MREEPIKEMGRELSLPSEEIRSRITGISGCNGISVSLRQQINRFLQISFNPVHYFISIHNLRQLVKICIL